MMPTRRPRFVHAWAVSGAMLATGCVTAPEPGSDRPSVAHVGAMRQVMREGRSQPRTTVAEVVRDDRVVAVGMEPELAGEITAIDGRCWSTRVVDRRTDGTPILGTVDLLAAPDARATMLTSSRVDAWISRTLTTDTNQESLLAAAEELARETGFAPEAPFALVVEAPRARLSAHVTAGACPHGEPAAAAESPPWRFEGETDGPVTVVGFRIVGGGGVSTHHGQRSHLHALFEVDGLMVSTHVDDLQLPAGARLRIPSRR